MIKTLATLRRALKGGEISVKEYSHTKFVSVRGVATVLPDGSPSFGEVSFDVNYFLSRTIV